MISKLVGKENAGKREQQRLFVALELPETVVPRLNVLKQELPGVKWTPPENLHLTLRFIGEMSAQDVPAVREALRTVRAACFSLRMQGLGMFARGRQIILWAGLEPSPDLHALKQRVDDALAAGARLLPTSDLFSPHVTLSRIKAPAPDAVSLFVKHHAGESLKKFSATSFALFRSELRSGGAIHFVEERYPLFAP